MLLRGMTAGHPFQDGNKRTGFLRAAYYLDLTCHPFPDQFDFDAAEALSRRVSSGELRDVPQIAGELARPDEADLFTHQACVDKPLRCQQTRYRQRPNSVVNLRFQRPGTTISSQELVLCDGCTIGRYFGCNLM